MKYRNKEWLVYQYCELKLSSSEIAKKCNCAQTTILRWLTNFGIVISRSRKGLKENISYKTLHEWIRRHKERTNECNRCGKRTIKLVIHNLDGKYTRNIEDYEWLCNKCHSEKDGFKYNLKQYK